MADIPPRKVKVKIHATNPSLSSTNINTPTPATSAIPQPSHTPSVSKPRKKKRKLDEDSSPDPAAITAAIQAALAGQRRPPSFLTNKASISSISTAPVAPTSAPSAFATPPSVRVVKPKTSAGVDSADTKGKGVSAPTSTSTPVEQNGAGELQGSISASVPEVKRDVKVPQKGRPKKKAAVKKTKDESSATAEG